MFRITLLRPVAALLTDRARRIGDRIAFQDRVRAVDYRALEVRTARIAGHLVDAGLRPGEPVVVWLDNRVEAVEATLAVTRAGGIAIPVRPTVADRQVCQLAVQHNAFAVFAAHDRHQVFRWAPTRVIAVAEDATTSTDDPPSRFDALVATNPLAPPRDDLGIDDPAWLLHGTGESAPLLATQRSSVWSVLACFDRIRGRRALPLALPYSYAHLMCILGVIALGGTARLATFSPDEILDAAGGRDYTLLTGIDPSVERSEPPAVRVCLATGRPMDGPAGEIAGSRPGAAVPLAIA
ncbi:AMP-binding protein [Nocardia amamiensis]|uniref:AMP-binding protein n=1 Tax=Nocardia amamiensis TaxID=404578 RepID=UPI0008330B69|nr:AMP-binding protein [Nocardia amamiensis]